MTEFAVPGEVLGLSSDGCVAMSGTYVSGGRIISSRLGSVSRQRNPISGSKGSGGSREEITVELGKTLAISPRLGDVVVCRVLKINPRQISAQILIVNGTPVEGNFTGTVRIQDVRETDTITLKMVDCYRPGDIIVAEVLSLGDSRNFFLSTAKNEFGVINARNSFGERMVPVNWQEMMSPESKRTEKRKVAKFSRDVLEPKKVSSPG